MMNVNDRLLEQVQMECPICDKFHTVEKRARITQGFVKNEVISYEEIYFVCTDCADSDENEFVPSSILDANLLNARNAYRIHKGLLTSIEIALIRKDYGLTQSEFSALFGWGDVTITRYETKQIQDETYDRIIRMAKENPQFVRESLLQHRERFTPERFSEIKQAVDVKIGEIGVSFLRHKAIMAQYAEFDEPSDMNGNQELNLEKVGTMMSYFANAFHCVYKVKMMKLLWFADALCYSKTGKAMSGLVYQHAPYGALPIASKEIIYLPDISVVEEEDDDHTRYRIQSVHLNLDTLTETEQAILSEVFLRFKNTQTIDLVELMHKEDAYTQTVMKENISFALCKKLRSFGDK